MADVQRNVHVRAQAPDVVVIQHLGILAPQHTALAARLAIVQAPPGVEHIGTALGFGAGAAGSAAWRTGPARSETESASGTSVERNDMKKTRVCVKTL